MKTKIKSLLTEFQNDEIASWKADLEEQPAEFSRLAFLDCPRHIDNLYLDVPECSAETCFPDVEFEDALIAHKAIKSLKNLSDFEYFNVEFHEIQTRESALAIFTDTLTAIYKRITENILPEKEKQFLAEIESYNEIRHAADAPIIQMATASPTKQSQPHEAPHASSAPLKKYFPAHTQTKSANKPDYPTIS